MAGWIALVLFAIGLHETLCQNCDEPAIPKNGYLAKQYEGGAGSIEYACTEGYEIKGQSENFCVGIGDPGAEYWAFATPECIAKYSCPLPPAKISHGEVSISDGQNYDSEATVECDGGYVHDPLPATKSVCQRNGEWEPPILSCVLPTCTLPSSDGLLVQVPDYFHREGNHVESGADAYFKCHEGYTFYGEASATCRKSGEWDKTLPDCIPVPVPPPPPPPFPKWLKYLLIVVAIILIVDALIRIWHAIRLFCAASLQCSEQCIIVCLLPCIFYGTYKLIFFVQNLLTFKSKNIEYASKKMHVYDDVEMGSPPLQLAYEHTSFSTHNVHSHLHRAFVPAEVAKLAKKPVAKFSGAIVGVDTKLQKAWLGYAVMDTGAYSFVIEHPSESSESMELHERASLMSYCVSVWRHPQSATETAAMFRCNCPGSGGDGDSDITMQTVLAWISKGEQQPEKEQLKKWEWTESYARKCCVGSYLKHWRPAEK